MPDNTVYGLEHQINGVALGDFLVLGRPLRSFSPTEFTDYTACIEFAQAFYDAVPVGDDFCHVMGQEFHDAYYEHRDAFIDREQKDIANERMLKLIRRVLNRNSEFELIKIISVAHVGWEMDNEYAVIRHDGEIKYVGTDHGGPRLHDRAFMEDLLKMVEAQATELRGALSLV
jgi:hypothetical protein